MATPGPAVKGKTGFGGFSGRFKDFVHDSMKGLSKDIHRHRRGIKSEQVRLKELMLSEDTTTTTSQGDSGSDRRSLFHENTRVRSLSIRVTVNFGEPLNYSHSQDYEASSSLQPTEELCETLLHRVDHCSKELITRKDSSALDRTGSDGLAKPLRYEIQLQILRNEIGTGTETWASRTVRSYQRQPLGTEAARDVIISTHHMVGLFLRHHDEAFVWKDGPVREDPSQEETTFLYRPGRVQPLTSVPRSNFIEKQQDFESIPGYTVSLSFTSENRHRIPPHWHETIEVNSDQFSPLTLARAEGLFFDACYAVDGVLRTERKAFEAQYTTACANHDACQHCRPHEGDGIEMLLSVKNNIGPLFENLERTTCASVSIFWKPQAQDCIEFVEKAKSAITHVCREVDESVSQVHDFEFYIIELRGRGWNIDQPLVFTLGPELSLSRRTIEALLDRLQTGVADILRGNAIAVRMTARKRGHHILDKTLVAREPVEKPGYKKKSPAKSKAYVLDRLKQRIERDIDMICKDTFSIVNRDMMTKTDLATSGLSAESRHSMVEIRESHKRLNELITPSNTTVEGRPLSSAGILDTRESDLLEMSRLSSASSPSPIRHWTKVSRDPETGLRLFPLVPKPQGSHIMIPMKTPSGLSTQPPTPLARVASDSGVASKGQQSPNASLADFRSDERQRGSSTSTRPETPSLEYSGGSPSLRSSIPITPRIQGSGLNHDIEILQSSTPPEVETGEGDKISSADTDMKVTFMHRPVLSPTPHLFRRDSIAAPSPIRHAWSVLEEQHLDSFGSDETTPNERVSKPAAQNKEQKTPSNESSSSAQLAGEKNSVAATEERLSNPTLEVETAGFSQSKPDFDFSSPQTATSPNSSEANSTDIDKAKQKKQQQHEDEYMSPDPSDDESHDIKPVRPALPQQKHRNSFGSAGYLGSFHEQRFYGGMGLRRALMGASTPPPRPFSPLGDREGHRQKERERPGTAM